MIFRYGAHKFKELGTADSRGSKVFSISGDTPKPGIYELELGMTVDQFVQEFGDGDTKAVQVGGASGFCVPRKKFKDTIIGFEGVPTGGSMMLFNSSRSMYNVLHNYLEFLRKNRVVSVLLAGWVASNLNWVSRRLKGVISMPITSTNFKN